MGGIAVVAVETTQQSLYRMPVFELRHLRQLRHRIPNLKECCRSWHSHGIAFGFLARCTTYLGGNVAYVLYKAVERLKDGCPVDVASQP